MKDFFLIAGFQRSGSTFLYNILDKHDQILMNKPVRPEPKFFINNSIKQSDLYNYFEKYFEGDTENLILGEKSTSYIEHENALINYKKLIPAGKIILILRNPIDRAISNYKFSLKHGVETRTLEEVFIKKNPPPLLKTSTSVSPFDYIQRGNYLNYIKVVNKFFAPKEICFICLEHILNNTSSLKKIELFLNINPFDLKTIDSEKKVNYSDSDIDLTNEIKATLKNHYKKDMEELQNLTSLDLTNWKL